MATDETATPETEPAIPETPAAAEVVEETAEPVEGGNDTSEGHDAGSDEETEDFITAAEIAAVQNDPEKLRKQLLTAYTKKTTALKQQRQAAGDAIRLVQWMQEDPERAFRALAAKIGVQLPEDPSRKQIQDVTEETMDTVLSQLTEAAGPDVAKALTSTVQTLVQNTVQEALKPVKELSQQQATMIANARSKSSLEQFKATHPDFPKLEKSMSEIAKTFPVPRGVSDAVYLENLYLIAKGKSGGAAVEAAKRMTAAAAASSSPGKGQSVTAVSTPAHPRTIREAAELAKRGIRL